MGLLDGLLGTSADDPRSNALLALAGGMVRGDVGGGLLGYGQEYQRAQQGAMQRQLGQAQLQDMQQQQMLRELQVQQARQKMDFLAKSGLFGGSGDGAAQQSQPATQPTLGGGLGSGTYGIPVGGQSAVAAQPAAGGGLSRMSPDQVMGLNYALGQDVTPLWKIAKEGIPVAAGAYTRDATTGKLTYNADPTKMIELGPDGGVRLMPGAAATQSALTLATEAPKTLLASAAQVNLRKNPDGTESPVSALDENPTLRGVLASLNGGGASSTPQQRAAFDVAALNREIALAQSSNDPAPAKAARLQVLNSELAKAQAQAGGGVAPPASPSLAFRSAAPGYGMTNEQSAAAGAQKTYADKSAEALSQKGVALTNQLAESQALMQRIAESRDAMTKFRAGGGAETRSQLASLAQAIPGMPQDVVNKIAGGDLAALQTFQKYAVQEALQTMRGALANDNGQGSQGNRISMQAFLKNNPNIDTDPNATERIFNFLTGQHGQLLKEHDFFTNYMGDAATKKDPAAFANQWFHQQVDSGRVNPQIVTGQAMGTKPAPNQQNAQTPQNLPVPMKGMTRNGYRFTGGNPADASSWEKM